MTRTLLPLSHFVAALALVLLLGPSPGLVRGQQSETENSTSDNSANSSPDHRSAHSTCCSEDDLWLVSTRNVFCGSDELGPSRLRVTHRVENQWHISSVEQFAASQQHSTATVIYVHGNRMNGSMALQRGLMLYRNVVRSSQPARRIRFVIWSWPSDRSGAIVRDVRIKAARTNLECGYLAWFLRHVPQHSATSLVGYSFGARIITGALQSLHVDSPPQDAPASDSDDPPAGDFAVRAALLAAAVHTDWFSQGSQHAGAIDRADRTLLLFNPVDPALKRYRVVDPYCQPDALGYTGFRQDVAARPDVQQFDVSNIIGRSHGEHRYYRSNFIRARLRPFLLWDTMETAIAEP